MVAACGSTELDVDNDATVFGGAFNCPMAYCGSNSATIDHYGFHELNLDGISNDEGFQILGMSLNGEFLDLEVRKSRILASDRFRTRVTGPALKGAVIYLGHKSGAQYALTISEVSSATREVVSPYNALETYRFQWAAVTGNPLPWRVHAGDELPIPGSEKPTDICPKEEFDIPASVEWNEAAQVPPLHALVYEGDRIDSYARKLKQWDPDPRWFNLGCGPDALVKLRLSRSTLLTNKADWRLTQATLKMLSADYCGTGTPFTTTGEPLVWQSLSGMQLRSSATSMEARWNEDGARCLDEPRAFNTRLPSLSAAFPDIERAIANECGRPPPCKNSDPATYDPDDLVVSANRDL